MRSVSLLVIAILTSAYSGCGGSSMDAPADGSDHRVDAVGVTTWNPSPITIRAGEAVTFRNATGAIHNVQFDDVSGRPANVGDFGSTSKSVTFTTAGTFAYHCGIHPAMQGQVVVQQ